MCLSADRGQDLLRVEGLQEKDATEPAGFCLQDHVAEGTSDHDPCFRAFLPGPHQQLQPIELAQPNIGNQYLWGLRYQQMLGFGKRRRLESEISCFAKSNSEGMNSQDVYVDHQHFGQQGYPPGERLVS